MPVKFDCGCSFDCSVDKDIIKINYDVGIINFDCYKTWSMISDGNTKGVFQLESRLGQSMSKKLKPHNIEELSALISIMRPGCLEAYRDGKSVSNHYIDKKNGLESIDYFSPCLEPILKNTYGEMVYQEQAMEIAKEIAGFNLQEADMLRKAIGKKKPEEMAKVKTKFLQGVAQTNIISQNEAEQIFSWIEKSQRYSFNKSHAVSYAINAYMSAYTKAHFPRVFFLSYLRLAKDKINPQEEILELICNAKEMDINVYGPDIRLKNKEFEISNKNIYFGLTNIKGVGESVFIKLYDLIKDIDLSTYAWPRILFDILLKINSTAAKALILSGSLDFIKLSRNTMIHEYSLMNELSNKETEQCIDFARNIDTNKIENIIRHLISNGKITSNRKPKVLSILNQLHTPSYSMIDSPEWVSDNERELLGTSITCTKTDSYDASYSNTDCKDIKTFSSNKQFFVVAEISDLNIIKTKRGKNPGQEMCFIKISDSYGYADCVMFPDDFTNNRDLLSVGRVLMFNGQKGTKDNSIIIKKCFVV